jgi:hypothetical protein
VRADLREPEVLGPGSPLERVHFPTRRISLEAVIRLLVGHFGVPSNEAAIWRPVLAHSEEELLDTAYRSFSG